MSSLSYPPKPRPGDRVAVVSPSAALPELFPRPFELGLRRLREDFGLIPVEYPTTRKMGSGKPKAWSLDRRSTPAEREQYLSDQREAVLRALGEYAPDAMVVLDLDIGHTDPQVVIPYGGQIRVDGVQRRITVRY